MTSARISRVWGTILLTITIFSLSLPAYAKYSGGTGEPDDPYQIATAGDLMLLGETPEDYDKHFIMTADIDLDPNLPGRKVFDKALIAPDVNDVVYGFQGTPFTGVFDGNGHTISNLTITGGSSLGLFGGSGTEAEVKNLGLVEVNITGSNSSVANAGSNGGVGALAGSNGGTITSCYSTGTVRGIDQVGGLVGYNSRGNITESYSTGRVTAADSVGGLVGFNFGGSITASYSMSEVVGAEQVGGLIGENRYYSAILASYSTGIVTGKYSVGGLVGYNWDSGNITVSYSISEVNAVGHSGGLVGRNGGGFISNCYSKGKVTGDLVGGLVGQNDQEGSINSSFWDIQTSGQSTSSGGTGLTTAEMQDIMTFLNAGWDFVEEIDNGICDFWQISPGDYPRLCYTNGNGPVMPEGLGTLEQPYLIRNTRDLGTVWFEPTAHYRLEESVDLAGITCSTAIVPWFGGSFDGNGFVISSLHIQGSGYVGLFGMSDSKATISNLSLEAVAVNGTYEYVGSLVGYNGGNITTSYSTGSVSGDDHVGGLVGWNKGSITTSYSTSSVSGGRYVGGLAGRNSEGSITTSYSTGAVSGDSRVGGFVGLNYAHGLITTCYSTGAVNGMGDYIGGFVGLNSGWGMYSYGRITMCYSIGAVNGMGNYVGGLVGCNFEGSITSSFWDTQSSGQATSEGGIGKTTAEMKMADTFISWASEPAWTIEEGVDYPRLWWENVPGELITPQMFLGDYTGAENDPYLIYTPEQLNAIGLIPSELDKHFKLMADIDLSGYKGNEFNIIGGNVPSREENWWPPSFTGVFDGNGHTISNFTYECNDVDYVGFFGYVNGIILNLGLIDPNIDAGTGGYIGLLIGCLQSGTVTGCFVEGGNVVGDERVGGLVGVIWNGSITASYSMSRVEGNDNVGGLVGYNGNSNIATCYSTGVVSGIQNVGGLVGRNYSDYGSITSSFWDIGVSGRSTSAGGTGLTTTEMQTASTFLEAGWDFIGETANGTEDIWWIDEGQDYPRLWWESE